MLLRHIGGIACGLFAAVLVADGASAQHVTPHRSADTSLSIGGIPLALHGSIGVLNGESREIVYETTGNTCSPYGASPAGWKCSELIWKLDNVPMAGAGITARPFSWLAVSVDGWINISDDHGTMDDFDWLGYPFGITDWDHHSHHEDTQVSDLYMLDLNVEASVISTRHFSLAGIAGYKRDHFAWDAYGGTFVYSDIGGGYCFRCFTGTFTGLGISYQQDFQTPYLGIAAAANLGRLQLDARVMGSDWVDAKDKDVHHQRSTAGLTFIEDFEQGRMIAVDAGANYLLTDNLSVGALYHYQDYSEVKGSTTIIDNATGASAFTPGDAAGASHESHLFALSLKYRFGDNREQTLK